MQCILNSTTNQYYRNKQKMFLNLHPRNSSKLALDFNSNKQRSYLSSLGKLHKEKSYSTSSLKEEFRQFKNKSLSHANPHQSSLSQFRSQPYLPMSPVRKNAQLNSFLPNGNGPVSVPNMKLNDFKKSYLNLDSKLNKCTKPKDYFKPIQEPTAKGYPSTYLQVEKRLEQENTRRSLALISEINQYKEQNEQLRRQNQELRNQRAVDLQLIARQNKIMQKQQQLIEANHQSLYINNLNSNRANQSSAFTFSNNIRNQQNQRHQCEECSRKKMETKVEIQFTELKIQKLEEEKHLMKKEIHDLVYQCEKYKESLKITEEKYQKQLERNQKLISIIHSQDREKPVTSAQKHKEIQSNNQHNSSQSMNQYNQRNSMSQNIQSKNLISSINRQPYLNLTNQKQIIQETEPISIKREKGRIQYRPNKNKAEHKNQANSPIYPEDKTANYKYFSHPNYENFSQMNNFNESQAFNNHRQLNISKVEENSIFQNYYKELQRERQVQTRIKREIQLENEVQKQYEQRQVKSRQNMDWCQNQNIRKYLNEINKQKINEIQKIDILLKND